MDLKTAQGAVIAIRSQAAFDTAYTSYAKGHDAKHRESARAYSYNHDGATGDEPAGYYQKLRLFEDPAGLIVREVKTWGPTPLRKTYSQDQVDLTIADEKSMLMAALSQPGGYYASSKPGFFCFATSIVPGYSGHLFRGGGKVYPKIADQVTAMVMVIATGAANCQIVTHYPEVKATAQAMTALA